MHLCVNRLWFFIAVTDLMTYCTIKKVECRYINMQIHIHVCVSMIHMPDSYYDYLVANKTILSQMENAKSGNFFQLECSLQVTPTMPFTTQTELWSSVFRLQRLAICVSLNMPSQIPLPAPTEVRTLAWEYWENLSLITKRDAVFFSPLINLCCW